MGPSDLGFIHRYIPSSPNIASNHPQTLLLLHGTGGNEDDLLPLGQALAPGAAILSPRGQVLERGMPRFFRRLALGVFDQEDLARRTEDLAQFIEHAVQAYNLPHHGIVAVGFSNGANIATSLLFKRPGLLSGAILFSAMLPFEPDPVPDLTGTSIFLSAGRADDMVLASQTEHLATVFRDTHADLTLHWEPGGHQLTPSAVQAARRWVHETWLNR